MSNSSNYTKDVVVFFDGFYKKINKNFKYNLKQLTEYIEIEKSKELENFYVEEYKKNKWTILNKRKTGGLGGNILKWTKEKCIEEALKYTTRNDFKKYSATSYGVSCKNKWLNDICQHMIKSPFTQSGYWTKEKCQKEALKYTTRNDFRKNNPNAYSPCCDHKWLDDVCSHMNGRKINGYWTKENCQKEALKYNKKSSYKKSEPTSYRISRENGWLNEICLHMIKKKN